MADDGGGNLYLIETYLPQYFLDAIDHAAPLGPHQP
jgi:hypothetical protein